MIRLTHVVEKRVAAEMPEKFGLIFDGWTHDSEHSVAIFATYKGVDGVIHRTPLSISPIVNEPDDLHNAKSY